MKRTFIFSTIIFVSLFFSVNSAIACSCAVYDVPTSFEQSHAVFIGKVTNTGFMNSYVDFKVEKSWKSVDTDEISLGIGGCDEMNFEIGAEYLVYAYQNGKSGNLSTGSCTRTREISKAEEDLNFLKDKNTISLKPEFFTRNMKTGLTTTIFVLVFLGIGFLLIKFKKVKKTNL